MRRGGRGEVRDRGEGWRGEGKEKERGGERKEGEGGGRQKVGNGKTVNARMLAHACSELLEANMV